MSGPATAFSAHFAALARVPDPEDRLAARLLEVVVQDWTLLGLSPDPIFAFAADTLRVSDTTVRLPAPWRDALGALYRTLRAHGVGAVRLVGPIDRGTVLALLRGARALPSSAPREELQRWVAGHGGASMELLAPFSPADRHPRAALRAMVQAWAALADATGSPQRGPSFDRALHRAVDEAATQIASVAALLALVDPRRDRRATLLPILALLLGTRLGIGREGVADLVECAMDAAQLPQGADEITVAQAIARTIRTSIGRREARLAQTLWGLRPPGERSGSGHTPLFSRILALASDYEGLTQPDDPHALSAHEALARLPLPAGRRHDPLLVHALVAVLGRYPVGTGIVLETGEVCVVCRAPSTPERSSRPVARVVVDAAGEVLPNGPLVDLSQPQRAHTRIIATIDPALLGIDVVAAVCA